MQKDSNAKALFIQIEMFIYYGMFLNSAAVSKNHYVSPSICSHLTYKSEREDHTKSSKKVECLFYKNTAFYVNFYVLSVCPTDKLFGCITKQYSTQK